VICRAGGRKWEGREMKRKGNLDILTWCFFDRSGRGVDVMKGGDWYKHVLYNQERSGSREGREGNKERRKRKMMCTHLRVKLDPRSARPRKIKYEVCKVKV